MEIIVNIFSWIFSIIFIILPVFAMALGIRFIQRYIITSAFNAIKEFIDWEGVK